MILFWQKFDGVSRRFLPILTTLLFVFLGAAPWPIPFWGSVAPSFALVAVYYWAIHRPDLFGPTSAFFVGLLCDSIYYLDLGVTAFLFVAAQQLLFSQRRFFAGHSFLMLWVGFTLTMALVMIGHLVLTFVVHGVFPPLTPVLLQAALTIVLFPFPAWALIGCQRSLLSQG